MAIELDKMYVGDKNLTLKNATLTLENTKVVVKDHQGNIVPAAGLGGSQVVESLLFKGAGLGTILSFMMAVTTLSLPSMIMLKKAVKPQLLAVFIGTCTVGIVLVGYFFNFFQYFLI